jgi:two-component system, OmpR family, phosphate regulon sensor histidine kinase PhoR
MNEAVRRARAEDAGTPATVMAMTFRAKLLLSYFALVAAVELITILVLNQSLAHDLVARLDERLALQAKSSAAWVGARREVHGGQQGTGDRQAIRLAGVLRAWVMIFDAKGTVIGDSERLSGLDLPYTELEAAHPEVTSARVDGVGRATRVSKRHGEEMYFVAVAGERGLVVRLAVPLAEVTATIRAMRLRLLAASLLAFVVAVVLGLFAVRIVAEPLRAMTASASQLAKGNYDIVVPAASTPDEIGALGRALATLGSELKARIGELTRERDRLSAILETMVEGVLVIGWGQELVVVNPSAAAILASDEKIASLLAETMAKGESSQVEIESAERALVINVRPLAKTTGGGAVAVLHDVTQLRRLENMRREFVANASHELRTPVAAIQGYAETLLRGVEAKTQAEFLEVIHRHARRIARLVEDLLRLSEIEARAPEKITRGPVQIADVVANVEETMRERLVQRRIALVVEIEKGVVALAGEDELEQVLTNLVDNAIKYGREGGRIVVRSRRDRGRTIVEIEDDGPGIGEEHLPKIFERFYRVDPARSRALGGSGLGLSIVRRLVESMNGSISVDSAHGRGARFVVALPLFQ